MAMLERILLRFLGTVQELSDEFLRKDTNPVVYGRSTPDGSSSNMVTADPIAEHHVKRRRRRALLTVAFNGHALGAWTSEEEATQLSGVAVVVEVDKAVSGEEVDEVDRKSTRLNSSHSGESRMPSSA